jgi:hypothetical protein
LRSSIAGFALGTGFAVGAGRSGLATTDALGFGRSALPIGAAGAVDALVADAMVGTGSADAAADAPGGSLTGGGMSELALIGATVVLDAVATLATLAAVVISGLGLEWWRRATIAAMPPTTSRTPPPTRPPIMPGESP